MKNTPPRQVTTPCWLPSQPISEAVPSAPVKAVSAGRLAKTQSYLLAGPLPGVGSDVSAAGAAVAGGYDANPASEPTATTRPTAAATFIRSNMVLTLACLASRAPVAAHFVRILTCGAARRHLLLSTWTSFETIS